MKIIIYQNREVYKEESKIGNDSENKVETLEFEFPEEYKDFTKYIEFQTKDEKYVDLIEDDKYIITRAIAKYGKIKAQIVLRNSLENDVAVFKSDIFELKVSKSINATIDVPIEYPTWIDNLTRLKQDIEHAEHERVSNENERISAEKTRQENFTKMQETVSSAVSNIKDLTDKYNENDKQKTEAFNKNFEEKQKSINDNAESKIKAFDNNAEAQTKTFNTNSDDKLAEYNRNHTAKMKEFDDNYDTKTKTFDDNAADKQNEFDENASDKLAEYNQNAKELINKVEQVQAENETLKAENKLIKEQIPSASASGNSVHIEDSGTLDFDWKINGGHAQAITTQPENYIDDREARGKTILEATSLYLPIVNLKAGNGYYFKIFNNNNKIQNDSRYLAAEFYDENKVKIKWGPLGFPVDFTEEMATKVKYAKIYYNGNDTDKVIGNTVIKKIGLKITSNVSADDIDMFVPDSPSPNYSSEIETVGSNVNFIPTNPDEWEQGSISNGKNISSTTRIRSKSFIDIVEGEDYYLSIQDNQYRFVNIALYKDDNTYLNAYSSYDITIKKEYFLKVNFPTSCKKIRFVIRKVDDTSSIIPSEIDVIKPKLEKGTVQTPWSPYNQGSVEIDVVNSNLLDFNVAQDSRVTVNKDGTLTINGTGGFGLNIDKLQLKAGITYYQKVELISGSISGSNINNTFLSFAGAGAWISSENFSQTNLTKDTEKTTIWINASAIFNNAVIKIWANTDKSDFVKHQSQTAIMPIQQEMLEGDYIADVEHHEWRKYVFTGEENIGKSGIEANNSYWINQNSIPDLLNAELLNDSTAGTIVPNFLSTHFKTLAPKYVVHHNNIGITLCANNGNLKDVTIRFGFGLNSDINTVDKCKTWLKSQYDAGTPVTISYKLATPIDLELTEEQKRVQNQKLYTYKNVTNIAVSDELASIDVTYKKDLETEHNKLQNEIDEIKQLIGTTETSALLLDNLQKDVESEVE